MTLLDQTRNLFTTDPQDAGGGAQQRPAQSVNVGDGERATSAAAGAILAILGLSRGSLPGLVVAGVGGALVYRGATGHCPAYSAFGLDTANPQDAQQLEEETSEHGIHVEQAFLINRSPDELYQYWRNFENLPQIMSHLESVTVTDEKRSHWVAKAPRLAGGSVEWDAEITADEPGKLIAWRSLPGAGVDNAGRIRFSPGMGDRGTEVHVFMDYVPPAGRLGNWVAKVLGNSPRRMLREDLRNFKRVMEIGEVLTVVGQPKGTCTGEGERQA